MPHPGDRAKPVAAHRAPVLEVAREWTRIGIIGFGGPPTHISLIRALVVGRRHWMEPGEFEDAVAACTVLPGPASTQLAIFCAYRVAGLGGAIAGGLGFIVPAVVMILALSTLFLAHAPPLWVRGAGAGAGAAVAAVAVSAAGVLTGPSLARVRGDRRRTLRWLAYVVGCGATAAVVGPYVVVALVACGVVELVVQRHPFWRGPASIALLPAAISAPGGFGALAWTAFKVGALSFGGGFVIVPLMQSDAVHTYHWMTNPKFLNAVALGQVTPGPIVATVAAVGYAAHGVAGGALAALVAFAPSFAFVLAGGRRFTELRANPNARAFLDGAGPGAIGAILGAAIVLARALHHGWQFGMLGAAMIALLALRANVVLTLVGAGVVGVIAALAGASVPA